MSIPVRVIPKPAVATLCQFCLQPGMPLCGLRVWASHLGFRYKGTKNETAQVASCIGDNVKIGAGSLVLEDLPAGCTAVGVPAKIIK